MKRLFDRLPDIWAKLDVEQPTVDSKGPLERFLSIDVEYERLSNLLLDLMRSHDVEEVKERFLPLLISHLGYRWRDYRPWQWNRERMQVAIPEYSYKGTSVAIADLVREHGGDWFRILDMASLVGVYDRQASMTQYSHYFDSDFYHPGVFQLWLSDTVDLEHFLEDFEYLKPAGTKWIIRLFAFDCYADIEVLGEGIPIVTVGATYDYTYQLYNMEYGFYDHIPQWAVSPSIWITDGVCVPANATFDMASLSFDFSDPNLQFTDWVPEAYNYMQPNVEPIILT